MNASTPPVSGNNDAWISGHRSVDAPSESARIVVPTMTAMSSAPRLPSVPRTVARWRASKA